MISIDVQHATQFEDLPSLSNIEQWVKTALQFILTDKNKSALTIRFIDKEESTELNEHYRHKKGPTNVLSFPDEAIPGFPSESFGDLAICAPLVAEEAHAQHKTTEAHFAHLVTHGFLHLLGYDHVENGDTEEMENLEIKILSQLGFKNPYEE
ncbi:rRNA maturation RNase YbeY [Coxiella endosymbiont of Ornithodoros maritimus]|uniref:rRNA maturation RNase YbeY n=1 Tax=Coxiella endosymbiont of Ornithodoros maritimus TaxID=1656172 RepID=UPI002264767F|nr:rRNA maturation RNase YbeY [Coxiella endosymbiont of Ornithodoros maritimus]